MIAGLRGEDSIAKLCRKEEINQNHYYRWSKDFGAQPLRAVVAAEAAAQAFFAV